MKGAAVISALLLASPVLAQDALVGEEIFRENCAVCHGETAEGDGPMSMLLLTAPPDLTGLQAANGGVFPTFRVVRQIDGRDPMLAHGGEMPLFGELFDFPDGAIAAETGQPIITARPIVDVVTWLQEVQR